ncbi:MAG: tripartite tricarboxylate transporter TctB family protein [Paracoccaceae bacterium]
MKLNDALIGAALIVFSLIAGLEARSFPQVPGQNYGAALFPLIISVGLGVTGSILVVSGLRRWRAAPLVDLGGAPGRFVNVGLVIAALVFYVLASETLGFIPTAFVIVAGLLLRLRGRPLSSIVIAAGTVLAVHQAFNEWLLVPLPWGVLEPLVF